MFKILDEKCSPTRGSKYSAAIDLYAREDIVIGAGETVKVPLGVCIDEDYIKAMFLSIKEEIAFDEYIKFIKSHYLQLEPRSSLRVKGLIAGTGIIDLDYKDEIMIILHNPIWQTRLGTYEDGKKSIVHFGATTNFDYKINKGDKIAQIMLCEHKSYLFGIESEEERTGGFGSTGL